MASEQPREAVCLLDPTACGALARQQRCGPAQLHAASSICGQRDLQKLPAPPNGIDPHPPEPQPVLPPEPPPQPDLPPHLPDSFGPDVHDPHDFLHDFQQPEPMPLYEGGNDLIISSVQGTVVGSSGAGTGH